MPGDEREHEIGDGLEPPDVIFGKLPPLGHQQDAHAVERVPPAPEDQDALGFCCRRKRSVLRPRTVIHLDPVMPQTHDTSASDYVWCVCSEESRYAHADVNTSSARR